MHPEDPAGRVSRDQAMDLGRSVENLLVVREGHEHDADTHAHEEKVPYTGPEHADISDPVNYTEHLLCKYYE